MDDCSADAEAMIRQIRRYGCRDDRVLAAMLHLPRHRFIPAGCERRDPYGDHPCDIGYGQTISQPYIVAYMSALVKVVPAMRLLEIGTGSGYQTAVLTTLGAEVYTIEVIPELAEHARRVLAECGLSGVHLRHGDGYLGWPEAAPFDAIIGTCAPLTVPLPLKQQLRDGGRLILPVGDRVQNLRVIERRGQRFIEADDLAVRFVPMVHRKEGNNA